MKNFGQKKKMTSGEIRLRIPPLLRISSLEKCRFVYKGGFLYSIYGPLDVTKSRNIGKMLQVTFFVFHPPSGRYRPPIECTMPRHHYWDVLQAIGGRYRPLRSWYRPFLASGRSLRLLARLQATPRTSCRIHSKYRM